MNESELPARLRPLMERQGLVVVGRVPIAIVHRGIRHTLPTMHHALQLFELVAARLGERARLDPTSTTEERVLYLRDESLEDGWTLVTPLLELRFGSPMGDVSEQRVPEPDILPDSDAMRAGTLVMREGPSSLAIRYNAQGLLCEWHVEGGDAFTYHWLRSESPYVVDPLSRPPTTPPLSLLCREDLTEEGYGIEKLARIVSDFDAASRVAARVLVPAPLPGGVGGVLARGVLRLRTLLFDTSTPENARFVAVDGLDGSAIGWGATASEAIASWRAALFREKPRPPEPSKFTSEVELPPDTGPREERREDGTMVFSSGLITLSFDGPSIPWPPAIPSATPGLLIPLPPLPEPERIPERYAAAGFSRWVRLVGSRGDVSHALYRADEGGFTLVGDGIVDLVDVAAFDEQMNAADARDDTYKILGHPDPFTDLRHHAAFLQYRCFDDVRHVPIPCEQATAQFGRGHTPAQIDGDAARWLVTRLVDLRRDR